MGQSGDSAVRHPSLSLALLAALLIDSAAAAPQGEKPLPAGPQPIPRASFIAQMDAQFGKMDADRNGRLDRAEIEQFEAQRAMAEAQERNAALFDQLDANRNGQISAAEFAKLVPQPAPLSAQPMLSREDGNRDGSITLVEHRIATLANFDRLDRDRDGVVSVAEMQAGGVAPR